MRTKIIIWLVSTLSFSLLFHQQSVGINFSIFLLISVVGGLILFKARTKEVLLCSISLILSAIASFINGNSESVIIGVLGLASFTYLITSKNTSFLIGLLQGLYKSTIGLLIKIGNQRFGQHKSIQTKSSRYFNKLLYLSIPIVISLAFILLYAASNQAFDHVLYNMQWHISPQFIFLLIIGGILYFGYFFVTPDPQILDFDVNSPKRLTRVRIKLKNQTNLFFKFKIEVLSGIVLFILLNLILSSVLIIDFVDLVSSKQIHGNSIYSDNVHQGIKALIVSIAAAIGLILYYFRGNLNFYSNNKSIRLLAKSWIILNGLFVISTMLRTLIYIDNLGLTYKRIGVIIYLALTLIGLAYTWIKIQKIRTNWNLIKNTFWSFFLIMSIYPLFNWDSIITKYNCSISDSPDTYYLTDLNNKNLVPILNSEKFKNDVQYRKRSYKPEVIHALIKFYMRNEFTDLRSFNIVDNQINQAISRHERMGDFQYVVVNNISHESFATLSNLKSIEHITLVSPLNINFISTLKKFKNLKSLTIKTQKRGRQWDNNYDFQKHFPDLEINIIKTKSNY